MTPCPTVKNAMYVQVKLREFLYQMRKDEEEVDFREYCDGIIRSAIATLGLITGDYK